MEWKSTIAEYAMIRIISTPRSMFKHGLRLTLVKECIVIENGFLLSIISKTSTYLIVPPPWFLYWFVLKLNAMQSSDCGVLLFLNKEETVVSLSSNHTCSNQIFPRGWGDGGKDNFGGNWCDFFKQILLREARVGQGFWMKGRWAGALHFAQTSRCYSLGRVKE